MPQGSRLVTIMSSAVCYTVKPAELCLKSPVCGTLHLLKEDPEIQHKIVQFDVQVLGTNEATFITTLLPFSQF